MINDDINNPNEEDSDIELRELTVIKNSRGKLNQPVKVIGHSDEDKEFNQRLDGAARRLSQTEQQVFKLICKGLSIRAAAKKLHLSQQRAQMCWKKIKEKL